MRREVDLVPQQLKANQFGPARRRGHWREEAAHLDILSIRNCARTRKVRHATRALERDQNDIGRKHVCQMQAKAPWLICSTKQPESTFHIATSTH